MLTENALSRPLTLSDVWFPRRAHTVVHDAALIAGASVGIALLAHVAIPLPGTPVPITGQTFGILLSGVVLGGRRGAMASALYLLEGAFGLPVFAPGTHGLMAFTGMTAGYLFAFTPAAWLVGSLAEHGKDRKPLTAFLVMLLGAFLILMSGSFILGAYLASDIAGFAKGFLPFVGGEVLKAAVAAAILPPLWRGAQRNKTRRAES